MQGGPEQFHAATGRVHRVLVVLPGRRRLHDTQRVTQPGEFGGEDRGKVETFGQGRVSAAGPSSAEAGFGWRVAVRRLVSPTASAATRRKFTVRSRGGRHGAMSILALTGLSGVNGTDRWPLAAVRARAR